MHKLFLLAVLSAFIFHQKCTSQVVSEFDSLYQAAINISDLSLDSMMKIDETMTQKYSQEKNYLIYHYRILGIKHDNSNNLDSATFYLLKGINKSIEVNNLDALSSLYIDIGLIYKKNKAYKNAKYYFLKAAEISKSINKKGRISTCFNNLGIIYRKQKLYDSALNYYKQSLQIKQELQDVKGLLTVNSNIGNLYLESNNPQKALLYFNAVLDISLKNGTPESSLFDNYINISATHVRLLNFSKFKQYVQKAEKIYEDNPDLEKRLALKKIWTGYYEEIEDYKNAYINYREITKLEDSLTNEEALNTTSQLLEKYDAIKRDNENKILNIELEKQKLLKRNWLIAFVSLFSIFFLVVLLLRQRNKRNQILENKNQEITKQNQMLAELNYEKNSLISIVSHDLSSPFANIKLWNSILSSDIENLDEEKKKAILRIKQAIESGELMIKKILDVERIFSKENHQLDLEEINISTFIEFILAEFDANIKAKNISVNTAFHSTSFTILSDKSYLLRILENIISNALKYSNRDNQIFISTTIENKFLKISIQDEGVGIEKEDLPLLFTKYGKIKSRPTAGEQSTGLGLSIVKRLMDELGAKIAIESTVGIGTNVELFFPF